MKKKYIYLIIIVLAIIGFSIFYKWKQASFLGLTEPQIETRASIIEYANTNKIYGNIYVSKNQTAFNELTHYFDFGQVYVFDENNNLLDCNLETLGGRCFQDITKGICDNMNVPQRKLDDKIKGHMIYNLILGNSIDISNDSTVTNELKPKYTIIYPWVKYAKASVDENSLKFMECVKSKNEVRVINLNLDMQSFQ